MLASFRIINVELGHHIFHLKGIVGEALIDDGRKALATSPERPFSYLSMFSISLFKVWGSEYLSNYLVYK